MPTAKKSARATNIIAGKPRKTAADARRLAEGRRRSAPSVKTVEHSKAAKERAKASVSPRQADDGTAAPPRPGIALRAGTKGATILGLLQRDDGATLAEMIAATGWQAHSVRGFLSGALRKKHGLAIASTKDAAGARRYRITG